MSNPKMVLKKSKKGKFKRCISPNPPHFYYHVRRWLIIRDSGFLFLRVDVVGRGSSGFSVLCLVCMGRVFGLNRYPFWFESDLGGVISWLLSSDDLVFTCVCYTPPSPYLSEGCFRPPFCDRVWVWLNWDIFCTEICFSVLF